MLFPRIPSRPVRYALIATHAFRDAISDVEVDFTRAEQAIADKLEALSTKLDELMTRLEAYDDAEATEKPKAKTKRRAAAGKGRTATKK